MKNGLTVTKDAVKQVLAGLNRVNQSEVLVGIPEEKGVRYADALSGGKSVKPVIDPNITNAEIGYIQNFGAPELNIPAREFMYSGIKNARTRINRYMLQAAQAAIAGKPGIVDKAMHAAGLTAADSVRAKIQSGPFQALAPATLAARRRRGRTGEQPLIDTAQLRNSITYVVQRSLVRK